MSTVNVGSPASPSAGDHEAAAGDLLVRVELRHRPGEHDPPPVHDVDAVRGLVDEVELLLGEEHRDAERLEVAACLHHALRDEGGEPLVRLVEDAVLRLHLYRGEEDVHQRAKPGR